MKPYKAAAQTVLVCDEGKAYRPAGWAVSPRNTPWNIAFSEALKAEGYVDGQNLVIDVQGYGLRLDELADHAAAIVKAQVDVIICAGEPPIRAAQASVAFVSVTFPSQDSVSIVGSAAFA